MNWFTDKVKSVTGRVSTQEIAEQIDALSEQLGKLDISLPDMLADFREASKLSPKKTEAIINTTEETRKKARESLSQLYTLKDELVLCTTVLKHGSSDIKELEKQKAKKITLLQNRTEANPLSGLAPEHPNLSRDAIASLEAEIRKIDQTIESLSVDYSDQKRILKYSLIPSKIATLETAINDLAIQVDRIKKHLPKSPSADRGQPVTAFREVTANKEIPGKGIPGATPPPGIRTPGQGPAASGEGGSPSVENPTSSASPKPGGGAGTPNP